MEAEEFCRALKEIVLVERELESAKIELSLKSDFNLFDFFKTLDIRGDGRLTQSDLKQALERVYDFLDFTLDDIFMFFKRFDRNMTGLLDFNTIGLAVLPFSREYSGLVTDRPEYYCRREQDLRRYFVSETRHEIKALWQIIFRSERQIESIRARLAARPYFNLTAAFDYCCRGTAGVIKSGDLRDLMAE